jgi:hypothetical protein
MGLRPPLAMISSAGVKVIAEQRRLESIHDRNEQTVRTVWQ